MRFEEASELYATVIETPNYKRSPAEKELASAYYFYLKCWDNMAPNLGEGRDCIAMLRKKFPKDPDCKRFFPMGNFKALEGLSHEVIYNKWVARYKQKLEDYRGRFDSIGRFVMLYIMKNAEEEGRPYDTDTVRKAIYMNLWQASKGMALEDYVHKQMLEEWKDDGYCEYVVASSEDENRDIDSFLILRATGEPIRKYSVKNERALRDETILKKRFGPNDDRAKLEPTHYIGYETKEMKKLVEKPASRFPRPENLEELRKKWQEQGRY